jgi:hypothetical protein
MDIERGRDLVGECIEAANALPWRETRRLRPGSM